MPYQGPVFRPNYWVIQHSSNHIIQLCTSSTTVFSLPIFCPVNNFVRYRQRESLKTLCLCRFDCIAVKSNPKTKMLAQLKR